MPCILNTLYYVATVLEEWGVTVVSILNIYFKKKLYMLHPCYFQYHLIFFFLAFFAIILF